jgi:BlaI family transcriptional regulator, penicillinase repressor
MVYSLRSRGTEVMARPRAKELTQRELELMHVFWRRGESTIMEVRDRLSADGRDLAYTTVATLVRILAEKGALEQTGDERPYHFKPARTFEEVSGNMLSDLLSRVFSGSREQLLVRLIEQRRLTAEERSVLEKILRKEQS